MESPFSDARKRFGELICRALAKGLQLALRRNRAVAVDQREYLTRKFPGFKEFLLGQGPSLERLAFQREPLPHAKR